MSPLGRGAPPQDNRPRESAGLGGILAGTITFETECNYKQSTKSNLLTGCLELLFDTSTIFWPQAELDSHRPWAVLGAIPGAPSRLRARPCVRERPQH